MINNTFVFNPIRSDFIARALETLYEFTDMTNNRVVIVDQTKEGLFEDWSVWQKVEPLVHLYTRPYRNLGFAKSMNEGAIHGLRWNSQFITCSNDDVEFINKRWWDGVLETFESDKKILAVNPMSPKEPGWGYGLEHGSFLEVLPYKKKYTEEEYDYLLSGDFSKTREQFQSMFDAAGRPNTYPEVKKGLIDAIATWCTVFRGDAFSKIGMFDERYYPGGGEDHELDARAYSLGYRLVGTTRSWIWHHWGQSKDTPEEQGQGLPIVDDLRWNHHHLIWNPDENGGNTIDPWGHWTDDKGIRHPFKRDKVIGVIDL